MYAEEDDPLVGGCLLDSPYTRAYTSYWTRNHNVLVMLLPSLRFAMDLVEIIYTGHDERTFITGLLANRNLNTSLNTSWIPLLLLRSYIACIFTISVACHLQSFAGLGLLMRWHCQGHCSLLSPMNNAISSFLLAYRGSKVEVTMGEIRRAKEQKNSYQPS